MKVRWNSLRELIEHLNKTTAYVVMRNFDGLPDKYSFTEHGDIDLLVENYNDICTNLGAHRVYDEPFRVHNTVLIRGKYIKFDFRFVGDGYYDKKWEKSILKNRIINEDGIYVAFCHAVKTLHDIREFLSSDRDGGLLQSRNPEMYGVAA